MKKRLQINYSIKPIVQNIIFRIEMMSRRYSIVGNRENTCLAVD